MGRKCDRQGGWELNVAGCVGSFVPGMIGEWGCEKSWEGSAQEKGLEQVLRKGLRTGERRKEKQATFHPNPTPIQSNTHPKRSTGSTARTVYTKSAHTPHFDSRLFMAGMATPSPIPISARAAHSVGRPPAAARGVSMVARDHHTCAGFRVLVSE